MSKCINQNHPDFIELLNKTGINKAILAADVSLWMDKNNSENIPSIEDLNLNNGIKNNIPIKEGIDNILSNKQDIERFTNYVSKSEVSKREFKENEVIIDNNRDNNTIYFNRELYNQQKQLVGTEIFTKVADQLSDKLGIKYEIIDNTRAKELSDKWNGEKAFALGDTVYILKDGLSVENAIHEYGHFFLKAIKSDNPELYNKIYNDFIQTNEGNLLMNTVKQYYSDYGLEDQKEELLTRALTDLAQNKILEEKPQGILNRILYAIKRIFRKVFSTSINLEKLDLNISLQDLAKYLSSDEFKIESSVVTMDDYAKFIRDTKGLITDLNQFDESTISKTIQDMNRILQSQLNSVKNNSRYKDLKETLIDANGANRLTIANENIKYAEKLQNDPDGEFKRIQQLAHTLGEVDGITSILKQRVNELNLDKSIDSRDKISQLAYYSYILSSWGQYMDNLNDSLNEVRNLDTSSELYKTISGIRNNVDTTLNTILKSNSGGLVDLFDDVLSNVRENIDNYHNSQVTKFKEDIAKGNTGAQKFLNDENEDYKRFNLSRENIIKYLKGDMGDTNAYSGLLEAGISSPDPIIGGFNKFIKTIRNNVDANFRQQYVAMTDELEPLYKQAHIDRSNPEKLGSLITFRDKTIGYNEDGTIKEDQVVSLLQPFKNYNYERDVLNTKIDLAKKEERYDDVRQLRVEQKELDRYFNQDFTDPYYAIQKIWDSPDGAKAYEKRLAIFDEINSIERTSSNNPEDIEEDLAKIKQLRRESAQLSSNTDINGNQKIGEDLAIAKIIQEYNKTSREFYDSIEKKGLFDTKYEAEKQRLIESGLNEESPEFKIQLDKWVNNNTRSVIDKSFYDTRQDIANQLQELAKLIPGYDAKTMDISNKWEEIFGITKGYKDEDGQIIGSDLTDGQINNVKTRQLELDKISDKYANLAGLTKDDQNQIDYLMSIKEKTLEQKQQLTLLLNKKTEGLSLIQKADYIRLIQELKSLQSKVATEYYIDTVNNYLSKVDKSPVDVNSAELLLNKNFINPLLELNPEFKEWFNKNHINKTTWSKELNNNVESYQRLYVWNRIQPNDSRYYKSYTLSDGKILDRIPNYEYYTRVVKDEFKTKKIIGQTVDNEYHWLPKSLNQLDKSLPNYDKFINYEYFKLEKDNPTIFKILQIYTKYHLQSQNGLFNSNKPGYQLPRFRKTNVERFQDLKNDPLNKTKGVVNNIIDYFRKSSDDYSNNNGNFSKESVERLVNADLFDNEIAKIPIKGLGKLDIEQVSLDIGKSISHFMLSAEQNKAYTKIQPLFKALLDTLETNGVKDVKSINKRLFITQGIKSLINSKKNNRLQILSNLWEREMEGIDNHNELGETTNKVVNTLMKMGSYTTLALDIPGAIKNIGAAQIQSFIESLNGKEVNVNEYRKGNIIVSSKFIPAMIADYNKISDKSLESQLFNIFDPVQGKFRDKLGKELSGAAITDFIGTHWAFAPRELGEIQAQGSFWMGMMLHQKLEQTINGQIKEINYLDAWEKKNGLTQLKEGIDSTWGEGGKNFNNFKIKMHELNQKLQGNYAEFDQPEAQRYTTLRLFNFMRRYLVSSAINRFSKNRIQVGMEGLREGYYVTSMRVAQNFMKTAKLNWHLYTNEEKRNVLKTVSEIGLSLMFMLLLRSIGWDPNDKDKYEKLKDNSWITNHLIYQLMALKSEEEQFIPLPGMGLDEVLRTINTPSIVFTHLKKYYNLVNDATSYMQVGLGVEDPSILTFNSKEGLWEEGDSKLTAHLVSMIGYKGTTINPEIGIKNFNMVQSRVK